MNILLDRTAHEAMFELPSNDGVFSQKLHTYLGELGAKRPAIVLAFPPKVAGTFLRAAAIRATGGELLRVVYAQGSRDGQPYLPTFIAYYLGGFCAGPLVAHIHMQAFAPNMSFLQAFGIRPVIMIRSIPDILASYWDMLDQNPGVHLGINCTIPADFGKLPADRKADFLIDILAPWYAGYYATWLDYAGRESAQICALDYSDFVQQPAAALEKLLQHTGVPRTREDCQAAIDAVWEERNAHRFNEGKEGRGHQYFDMRHFERISRMLSYYPSTTSKRSELLGL